MIEIFQNWKSIVYNLGIIIGAGIIGFLVHLLVFYSIRSLNKFTPKVLFESVIKRTRRPSRYLLILLGINIVIPVVALQENVSYIVHGVFRSLFITTVAWVIICLTKVGEDIILSNYKIDTSDNLQARKIYTETQTIRKILAVIIIIIAISLLLMLFDSFRQLGAGILASAGLASVIIGIAAQKIFGNILAGIQIAFTQPIRLDDVVIVENEWGRIEEITLTYVVVRIWDLRRLVLPISYFIEKPFQNWTRVSADMLGTVFLHTDYTVPVQEVREELKRILKYSNKWDGKVCVLEVTNATECTMELRALISAADSSAAWDLRCQVREKLIEFIRNKYPHALPKTRVELKKSETEVS